MISFAILLTVAPHVLGALNGPCTANGVPGICLTTSSCSPKGVSQPGLCPNDPTNVQCCITSCGSGGTCQFDSTCTTGNIKTGLCPGPNDFRCCLPAPVGPCGAPAVNGATLSLVKQLEGFVTSPSPNPTGLPTVGYGHLCQTSGCSEVPFSFPLTEAEASTLLVNDLHTFENCITNAIHSSVNLNDNQYGALVSWAFSEGCSAVGTSTLIARLNHGQDPNTVVIQELPKWVFVGGQVLQGRVDERNAEINLFQTFSNVTAHPPPC